MNHLISNLWHILKLIVSVSGTCMTAIKVIRFINKERYKKKRKKHPRKPRVSKKKKH